MEIKNILDKTTVFAGLLSLMVVSSSAMSESSSNSITLAPGTAETVMFEPQLLSSQDNAILKLSRISDNQSGVEITQDGWSVDIQVSGSSTAQSVSFRYRFRYTDGGVPDDIQQFTILIDGEPIDKPQDQFYEVYIREQLSEQLLSEEEIEQGLTVKIINQFSAGEGSLSASGGLTFIAPETAGDANFTFAKVNNRGQESQSARVTISVKKPSIDCNSISIVLAQGEEPYQLPTTLVDKGDYSSKRATGPYVDYIFPTPFFISLQDAFCLLNKEVSFKLFNQYYSELSKESKDKYFKEKPNKDYQKEAVINVSKVSVAGFVRWLDKKLPTFNVLLPSLADYKVAYISQSGKRTAKNTIFRRHIARGLSEWTTDKAIKVNAYKEADEPTSFYTVGLAHSMELRVNPSFVLPRVETLQSDLVGFRVKFELK